jgi:hypothetical protein
VALNWGIGSSSLNAEVKAFDRLSLRAPAQSYNWWTRRARCFGASKSSSMNPRYMIFGCCIGQLLCAPHLDLAAHRLEISLHSADADRDGIDQ